MDWNYIRRSSTVTKEYPVEKLAGPLGLELAMVIGTIANWQRAFKEYTTAEASYQKLLKRVLQLKQRG